MKRILNKYVFLIVVLTISSTYGQETISIDWNDVTTTSNTTATLQLVENPKVRPSSPIHKNVFKALKDLEPDYLRYVPWFPYPKMAVAELKAPTKKETFWNFSYLDSTMAAVMEATKGRPVVINLSTTPAWMWKTDSIVSYPENPYEPTWTYNQGTELRDPSMKELSGYFSRVFSWYTQGGFTDELGKYHKSGHYYKISYWEVLNEPDLEHNISSELYCKMYDAIVSELKKISPDTKFIGISTAHTSDPSYFEYFLDPKNHKEGIPIEGISYHHYSIPSHSNQNLDDFQYTAFNKADAFIDRVKYIESIRKRLSPEAFTMINEIGIIMRSPVDSGPIPNEYWNLAGAMYAHIFLELTKIGIDVAGQSQLVGYPTQFPDVSMVNWETGNPNARYWVLKLLKDNLGPGDKLVKTTYNGNIFIGSKPDIASQAYITETGKKLLLINKRDKEATIILPTDINSGVQHVVDTSTGENPPQESKFITNKITLKPFSVTLLEL
ncbi:MAG: hypothetical protein NXI00_16530 [Cytophagales bacterium]|nr:hypothetical protein [Cytophagales bacterium]